MNHGADYDNFTDKAKCDSPASDMFQNACLHMYTSREQVCLDFLSFVNSNISIYASVIVATIYMI